MGLGIRGLCAMSFSGAALQVRQEARPEQIQFSFQMKRQCLLERHWISRCQNVQIEMVKESIFLPQSRDRS